MFASFLPQIWLKVATPSQNRRGIPPKNGQDPVADRWWQVNVFVYFWDTRVAWIKRKIRAISDGESLHEIIRFWMRHEKTLRRIVHHLSSFINLYNMYRSFSSDPFPLEESCFFSVSDCRRVYGTNMATPGNDLLVSKPTPWMAPEDGSEFSGWWFGDSVGGQQVWSRSVETGKGKVGSSETAGWPHSVGNPLP